MQVGGCSKGGRHDVHAPLHTWLHRVFPHNGNNSAQGLPPQDSALWRIRRCDVKSAIIRSGNTMPGPDGIPYLAWRRLGKLGVEVLYVSAEALMQGDACMKLCHAASGSHGDSHDFNLGILCCPPKKVTGSDPNVGDYHDASATRPLSIVNTDNRIIANAARIRWEPVFGQWVSHMQRGFLKGRSMLSNVVDIDYEAMVVSLRDEAGALVLFDFKAAFPSVSQEYLMRVLKHLGLPQHCMNLVQALYDSNRCVISCKGGLYDGFPLSAGIRQGCPLSPLLFVVTVDMLLRELESLVPDALIRAFADDTAMVVRSMFLKGSAIISTFKEFGCISGLHLNLPKTALVPLWTADMVAAQQQVMNELPDWSGVDVVDCCTYLGFMTGPGKGNKSWQKATEKFGQRACLWGSQKLGLQYAARTYNTFAVPVLSYISQLEQPPSYVFEVEASALRRAASGPAQWATPQDLWYLKDAYGQSCSFHSVCLRATSSFD